MDRAVGPSGGSAHEGAARGETHSTRRYAIPSRWEYRAICNRVCNASFSMTFRT